jgi:hypothetical protein
MPRSRKPKAQPQWTDIGPYTIPPPDSTPAGPRPPDHLVAAARRDVPAALTAALKAAGGTGGGSAYRDGHDGTGAIHVMACELVDRLVQLDHGADAAAWALHEMIGDGLFTATPAIGDRLAAKNLRFIQGAMLKSAGNLWSVAPSAITLTPEDRTILEALAAEHPMTVTQESLAAVTRLSEPTVSKRLKYLRANKLVDKPHGPRKGDVITDRGLALVPRG